MEIGVPETLKLRHSCLQTVSTDVELSDTFYYKRKTLREIIIVTKMFLCVIKSLYLSNLYIIEISISKNETENRDRDIKEYKIKNLNIKPMNI